MMFSGNIHNVKCILKGKRAHMNIRKKRKKNFKISQLFYGIILNTLFFLIREEVDLVYSSFSQTSTLLPEMGWFSLCAK
jgi:hypothetical protein